MSLPLALAEFTTLPAFGTAIIYGILLLAGFTFCLAVGAGSGRPQLLRSARLSAYATSTLILVGVLLLAYGFLSHDFRIRYISRYSNREMTDTYLLTALWGGQDGSLLWWTFLLGGYIAGTLTWIRGKYRELEPFVIATLMVIVAFFAVLMMFPANPFEPNLTGAPTEGDGLNPLLQNYWMIIHPPCLYMGFVGCSVPFAFAIAALVTGRLDNEWIVAVRKWMLFAFLFLSIGNVLGMIWAYEELGWGGFWAWDPVENAACLPWFTAAAYVHSTIIQERRNMFKVWNVVLICTTFALTIFGTFLTRSGLIASVHSFAKSDIGPYFLVFLGFILAASLALIVWRVPQLRAENQVESILSREAMFVINNWALLGGMTFILIATTWPLISEALLSQKVTVGPPFYNKWMSAVGLVIFGLMGLAPLFGWKRSSYSSLKSALAFPMGAALITLGLHFIFGRRLGFPAIVRSETVEAGFGAQWISEIWSFFPAITVSLGALNLAVVLQEFVRGVRARQSSTKKKGEPEGVFLALVRLVEKARRRYGGYIVHVGITCMFLGFVGTNWSIEKEASVNPGETFSVGAYELRYEGTRMCPGSARCSEEENQAKNRRMLFGDLSVSRGGRELGRLSPAKFIYQNPEMVTSEVGLLRGVRDDLYAVLATANPENKRATFNVHVNPFVGFIWLGLLVLIFGCTVSLWPEPSNARVRTWVYARAALAISSSVMVGLFLAASANSPRISHRSRQATASLEPQGSTPSSSDLGGAL